MHNGAVCVSGDFNVNEKNVALQAFTNTYGKWTVSSIQAVNVFLSLSVC